MSKVVVVSLFIINSIFLLITIFLKMNLVDALYMFGMAFIFCKIKS